MHKSSSTIGTRLRKLREAHGLSCDAVAKAVGVSPSTYRDWEYGRSIQGEPYIRLAAIFNVGIVTLLTGSESKDVQIIHQIDRIQEQLDQLRKSVIDVLEYDLRAEAAANGKSRE